MVEQKEDNFELKSLLNEEESKENASALKKGENLNGGGENYSLWRKAAIFISFISIIFTTGIGVTFFVTSQIAGSPSAFGFAFAAVLDSLTSAVVLWRFCGADDKESNSPASKERRACIAIAVCFILSAVAIACRAVYALVEDNIPGREELMKLLSIASLVFLVFLVGSKFLIASKVRSRAMKTDAINSLAGAVMTLGMIASDDVCEKNRKICFLDSATAILIAVALMSYGIMTLVDMMAKVDKNQPLD
ncbi:transmembrane protein 163a-like isoform X2 [Montipora capricornis]|uniref:transmembrane protein 163a-like isoform X2 n=1 Tax=Montipora capricornis TaxID=246305 RepID=UPI0035F10C9E